MFVKKITNNKIIIEAPAKINLFLEVLNKREDGYHNINSLFQAVSLYDRLEFSLSETPGVSINILNTNELPVGQDNLITKAYKLLKDKYGLKYGLEVNLEKSIPIASGLGGGSSDAAATIIACNNLFNMNLSVNKMSQLSLNIGTDVPFFFTGGQALACKRGEMLQETDFPVNYSLVLVNPAIPISTAQSYAALKMGLTISKNPFNLAQCRTVEKFIESLSCTGNDFEKVHYKSFPELGRIRDGLLRSGALIARMSGSGPTMFGIFYEPPEIKDDFIFAQGNWHLYTVKPITLNRLD